MLLLVKKDAQARENANKPAEQSSDNSQASTQAATFRAPNPLHPATEFFDLLSKDGKVPINLVFAPYSKGLTSYLQTYKFAHSNVSAKTFRRPMTA